MSLILDQASIIRPCTLGLMNISFECSHRASERRACQLVEGSRP